MPALHPGRRAEAATAISPPSRGPAKQVGATNSLPVVQLSGGHATNCPAPSPASTRLPIHVVALALTWPLIQSLRFKLGRGVFFALMPRKRGP